jgi:hypothetical protein
MRIGNIDFNVDVLAVLPSRAFNKFWKDGKFEDKTGKKAEDVHTEIKAEKEKSEKK